MTIEPNRKQLDFLYKEVLLACKEMPIRKNSVHYSLISKDSTIEYTITHQLGYLSAFYVDVKTNNRASIKKEFTLSSLSIEDKEFFKKIENEHNTIVDNSFKEIFNNYSIDQRDSKYDRLFDSASNDNFKLTNFFKKEYVKNVLYILSGAILSYLFFNI